MIPVLCVALVLAMVLARVALLPTHTSRQLAFAATPTYEGGSSEGSSWQYQVGHDAHAPLMWTVECRSGVAGEDGKLLRPAYSLTVQQTETGDGVRWYVPAAEINFEGQAYACVQDRVMVPSGGGVLPIYYVPAGYELTEDYKITIRYMDIADPDGAPIETFTHAVPASTAAAQPDDVISIPGSIRDGAFVLVPGQLFDVGEREGYLSFRHSCYAPERTYTFYYRAIDDVAHANTVLERADALPAPQGSALTAQMQDGESPLEAAEGKGQGLAGANFRLIAFGGLLGSIMALGITLFAFFGYKKGVEDRENGLDFEEA